MKTLCILGSTGSIGVQTLQVLSRHPEEFQVLGLTTNNRIDILREQIGRFKPQAVAVRDEKAAATLRQQVSIPVHSGDEGIMKIATLDGAHTIVNSLVGSAGVSPTAAAIEAKKNIALANKETLIAAGKMITGLAKKHNVSIMPIDSEHSALFQCLNGEDKRSVKRIILTCSGGPFKNKSATELQTVTAEEALRHPTWNMGKKITIDSATLMNKGFEVIEAHWLYGIPYEKIEVIIHPQSIIHSMVEFEDSSMMAQMGVPDMTLPIQYALTYPKRLPSLAESIDFSKHKSLSFDAPDFERFPCLRLAYEAGKAGGLQPTILNAANEIANAAFIEGDIGFTDIPRILQQMLTSEDRNENPTLKEILAADARVKGETHKMIAEQKVMRR